MAYGFNLGQIEGLDSSVKTVTLTIANATESNTYTLTYNNDNENWTDDIDNGSMLLYYIDDDVFGLEIADFTESDVGDTYNITISVNDVEENFKSAVETVLADNGLISAPETLFDGTITITAEDTRGVEIPFDMDVSSYPFEKWTVMVNGLEIPYQAGREVFEAVDDNICYLALKNDGVYMLQVIDIQGAGYPPAPGDYKLKIVGKAESKTDSDNTIYIDTSGDGVATMSVDPTILYDAINTSGTIPRVVTRSGGGAAEITEMSIPDRPANTIFLSKYSFSCATIEGGSIANEFIFTVYIFSFTKGNKNGTFETVYGTIPFTPRS